MVEEEGTALRSDMRFCERKKENVYTRVKMTSCVRLCLLFVRGKFL